MSTRWEAEAHILFNASYYREIEDDALNSLRFPISSGLEYWNVGILGFGLRLVEPTARRGNWDAGTMAKFIVDMGEKVKIINIFL